MSHNLPLKNFIDNEYIDSSSKEYMSVYSPVTEELLSDKLEVAGEKEVDAAVASARKAFNGPWSELTVQQRRALLLKVADLIEANIPELARLEALQAGKAITFATMEFQNPVEAFRYYAGYIDKMEGESFMDPNDGFIKIIRHEPLGVCVGITSFNVPLLLFAAKVAPALAMGNTIIVKPSERNCFSTMYLGKLFKEAGFPPGVLNIVIGAGNTGALLARHPDVNKISFTGSVATGIKINVAAAGTLKRVTLELGGKSPSLVFSDCNMDIAIKECLQGFIMISGQICAASTRIYVEESIAPKFVEALKQAAEGSHAIFGNPEDRNKVIGTIVDRHQHERVKGYIETGKSEGTLLTGGEGFSDKGFFVKPTIFTDTKPGSTIEKEEIFGPVVVINTFKTEAEAIERANDSEFALSASVFTQDINRAMRVSKKLQAGTVQVNCTIKIDSQVPFGGFKKSGLGRENGKYAIRHYTEPKTIFINNGY